MKLSPALTAYLAQSGSDAASSLPTLPLPDEAHLPDWERYAARAATLGVIPALTEVLPQLRFPIAAGTSQREDYRAATRRGEFPDTTACAIEFTAPERIRLEFYPTAAGRLPVLTAPVRADFERLLQALTARNEPEPIPASMGACIVGGYNNFDRIHRHRERWRHSHGPFADWSSEFKRYTADKRNYQDRFVLLSEGPYAAVPAADLGLDPELWLERSWQLRAAHECTHYLTARVLGSMRNNLLDELAADYVGILTAFGHYSAPMAERLLGVDTTPTPRPEARVRNYLGTPPLPAEALPELADLARRVIAVLAQLDAQESPADAPLGPAAVALTLFQTPLDAVAMDRSAAELRRRYQSTLAAIASRSTVPAPRASDR